MKKPEYRPWLPERLDIDVMYALQALEKGEATPEQQKKALKWIMFDLARMEDMDYFPDNERDTAFAAGKRHVALRIRTILRTNIGLLTQKEKLTLNIGEKSHG